MEAFGIVVAFNAVSIVAGFINAKKALVWLIGSCLLDMLMLFCIMQANGLFELYG